MSDYGNLSFIGSVLSESFGEKVNFSATASHKNTKNIFVIDAEGRITEKDK